MLLTFASITLLDVGIPFEYLPSRSSQMDMMPVLTTPAPCR